MQGSARVDSFPRLIGAGGGLLKPGGLMASKSSSFTFVLRRAASDPGWVIVSLRKTWWTVTLGTRSRLLAETWFLAGDKPEGALLEDALLEMLRCLANRQE